MHNVLYILISRHGAELRFLDMVQNFVLGLTKIFENFEMYVFSSLSLSTIK